jgi:hypothetical protein
MLYVIMLRTTRPSDVMPSVILLSAVVLSVAMLNVIMVSILVLSVVAPSNNPFKHMTENDGKIYRFKFCYRD